MAQELLGRVIDIGLAFAPVDASAAAVTGKRVALRDAARVVFVVNKAAGTAGEDPTFTVQQHTAASGGTSGNLAVVDHYYVKTAVTTLAGTETWTKVTQSAAATVVDPGNAGLSAESQQLLVIEVDARSLSDGYKYVSLSLADVGASAQLASAIYILGDLTVQRAPEKLAASLA